MDGIAAVFEHIYIVIEGAAFRKHEIQRNAARGIQVKRRPGADAIHIVKGTLLFFFMVTI